MICFGYAANYNTQGAFVINFLICSNLPNCLIFTKKFFIETVKAAIFPCFDVFPVRPPQKVQAKISTKRPVFPDYLSVSYDYVNMKVSASWYYRFDGSGQTCLKYPK